MLFRSAMPIVTSSISVPSRGMTVERGISTSNTLISDDLRHCGFFGCERDRSSESVTFLGDPPAYWVVTQKCFGEFDRIISDDVANGSLVCCGLVEEVSKVVEHGQDAVGSCATRILYSRYCFFCSYHFGAMVTRLLLAVVRLVG